MEHCGTISKKSLPGGAFPGVAKLLPTLFKAPRGFSGPFGPVLEQGGKAMLRGQKRHLPEPFPARFPARKGWPPGAETTRRRGRIWRFGASQTPDQPLQTPSDGRKLASEGHPGAFLQGGAREKYCHNHIQTAIFARFGDVGFRPPERAEGAFFFIYRRKRPRQILNSSRENSELALDDFRFVLGEFRIRRGRISNPPREKSGFA